MNRTYNRPKGFGFITFQNPNDAKVAKEELHDKDILGRPIRVDLSLPKGVIYTTMHLSIIFVQLKYFFLEGANYHLQEEISVVEAILVEVIAGEEHTTTVVVVATETIEGYCSSILYVKSYMKS